VKLLSRIKRTFRWYKFLKDKKYSLYNCVVGSLYNSKHWEPAGTWPYHMKKVSNDKSEHRLYSSKYEDLCM